MIEVMHVIGGSMTDTIYTMDFGYGDLCWNITAVERGIKEGLLGKPKRWKPPMPELADNWRENVDREKLDLFKTRPDILKIPLIGVGTLGPDGMENRCFIDGNHRLIAMIELGYTSFKFYFLPPEIERNFRVVFMRNGKPV